jgi:hypothetical protein
VAPHAAVEVENTADVLRVCVEVGERPRILHWVFDELKEAVIGTYPRRVIRHEVARSVEVDLLRGLHGPGRRRGSREILKERSRTALSSSPTPSLPRAIPCPNIPTSHVSRRLLRGRGSREILKERSRAAALSSSPTPSLPQAIPCRNIPTSHVSRRLLRGIPRPITRSEKPDGGPLRYRVLHTAALWKSGERPQLKTSVLEGGRFDRVRASLPICHTLQSMTFWSRLLHGRRVRQILADMAMRKSDCRPMRCAPSLSASRAPLPAAKNRTADQSGIGSSHCRPVEERRAPAAKNIRSRRRRWVGDSSDTHPNVWRQEAMMLSRLPMRKADSPWRTRPSGFLILVSVSFALEAPLSPQGELTRFTD